MIARRFRGFLPVVIDVETGGFDAQRDALLEIAAVLLGYSAERGWHRVETVASHVVPFQGANLDPAALEFNGIDPHHPFRMAVPELQALEKVFQPIRKAVSVQGCNRAVMVGHNPAFDLSFLKAAVARTGIKRNPFHAFSTFDTACLSGVAYGQTVLARAADAAGLQWDSRRAHSAIYDAEMTAELFCAIVNTWDRKVGIAGGKDPG
ncbi:MAG: ribonuclease T [Gammaproteobacteria bacterium]|nr:ribonuclease T [Gammaproteobacteria bacterium]